MGDKEDTAFMLAKSYEFMAMAVKTFTHEKDEGQYSDELKLGINCTEWMSQFKEKK